MPRRRPGLEGLTRSLALDYAEAGVRVNAIAPGYTETHLVREWLGLQDDPEATLERVHENIPLGGMAPPCARSATPSRPALQAGARDHGGDARRRCGGPPRAS